MTDRSSLLAVMLPSYRADRARFLRSLPGSVENLFDSLDLNGQSRPQILLEGEASEEVQVPRPRAWYRDGVRRRDPESGALRGSQGFRRRHRAAAAGSAQDAGEGTDFFAVEQQRVSVTPLQIDLTHTQQLNPVREWLR